VESGLPPAMPLLRTRQPSQATQRNAMQRCQTRSVWGMGTTPNSMSVFISVCVCVSPLRSARRKATNQRTNSATRSQHIAKNELHRAEARTMNSFIACMHSHLDWFRRSSARTGRHPSLSHALHRCRRRRIAASQPLAGEHCVTSHPIPFDFIPSYSISSTAVLDTMSAFDCECEALIPSRGLRLSRCTVPILNQTKQEEKERCHRNENREMGIGSK